MFGAVLQLIVNKGQVWRLFTNFLFFGTFSLDFLFHMYFLVRYCRSLEEGSFRGRTADFVWMIMFGVFCMTAIGECHFLSPAHLTSPHVFSFLISPLLCFLHILLPLNPTSSRGWRSFSWIKLDLYVSSLVLLVFWYSC